MLALGLPDFGPVQNNISFNNEVGVTRGIHAEPWDKFVSVATGRVFGAWVDLREGPSFGAVYTCEIGPSVAVFVPRGVGNSYQTLEPDTAYTYLVNDHWSADALTAYSFLNLADESAAIDWPIDLAQAELSEKDRKHPRLHEITPLTPDPLLIVGASGQLGRELVRQLTVQNPGSSPADYERRRCKPQPADRGECPGSRSERNGRYRCGKRRSEDHHGQPDRAEHGVLPH